MKVQEKYLSRAFELAKIAQGKTYPNPMVGCVIVHKDKIIGEGWHRKAGEPHAEVMAVRSVKNKDLLEASTVYVSLEPCAHFGKTPPCADLLVAQRVKRVVIASFDPFSKVAGQGIERLKNNGIEVEVGFMLKEAFELNKRFFTFHLLKRPYVILKFAQSKDGFIDSDQRNTDEAHWISNAYAKQWSHRLRAEEEGILIGRNTAQNDNPSLTCRAYRGDNPIRIVIDPSLKLKRDLKLFKKKSLTWVLTSKIDLNLVKLKPHVKYFEMHDFSAQSILSFLYKKGVQSLIVEGGAHTLQSFIDEGQWDELWRFTAPKLFGSGLAAPNFKGEVEQKIDLDSDVFEIIKPTEAVGLKAFLDSQIN